LNFIPVQYSLVVCFAIDLHVYTTQRWKLVGRPAPVAGRVAPTSGARCVTGRPHKMQKEHFFKYKPKTVIDLLQSLQFLFYFFI